MSTVVPTTLHEIDAAIQAAASAVGWHGAPQPAGVADRSGVGALERFMQVARRAAADPRAVAAAELTAAAEQGLGALARLHRALDRPGLGTLRDGLDRATAGLAVWLARQGVRVATTEVVVDAFARIANRTRDPAELAVLSDRMGEVLAGLADVTGEDRPGHPWRILNLNRGIVATRSHDPRRMEAAFETLVRNLPGDAARFFREGMGQMEALDYPREVRAVMERYYRAWSARTLH